MSSTLDLSQKDGNKFGSTGKSLVSFVFSDHPVITSEKLNCENYLHCSAAVNMWFLGQKLSDHLTKKAADMLKSCVVNGSE